jgi:hypothetical protein
MDAAPPYDDPTGGTAGTAEDAARLYLLVGPPAVGKLSVSRAIAARTGAIVVDNHLVNNAVFVPLGVGRDAAVTLADTDLLRKRVLDVVLEATLAAPPMLSHVFTNWLPDEPENATHVERLRSIAERRRARFVPVWLNASEDALLARVDSPGRAERSKLTDRTMLRELLEVPSLSAPPDALELDMTTAGPEQTAARILDAVR